MVNDVVDIFFHSRRSLSLSNDYKPFVNFSVSGQFLLIMKNARVLRLTTILIS